MEKKRIGVIFGGRSGEHEVSLLSAASVIRAIDKDKFDLFYIGITKDGRWMAVPQVFARDESGDRDITPEIIENGTWQNAATAVNPWDIKNHIDFALPIMHGPYCEDGRIQGLLEMLDIPYGGCGVLASAMAMDKAVSKEIFRQNGLPVCEYVLVTGAEVKNDLEDTIEKIERAEGALWDIQVGAFSKRENALNFARKLKSTGFENVILQKNETVLRVSIKAVPSEEVNAVVDKLVEKGYNDLVVRLRKSN